MPKVITANHLLEGDVIYLTADRGWSRSLNDAVVVDDDTATELLAFAEGQPEAVVGAYLMNVAIDADELKPTHFREDFRTKGPSNYFHGKQEAANV